MSTSGDSKGKGHVPTGNPIEGVPLSVECQWFEGKPNVKKVKIVRLLVDRLRWTYSTPNEQHQRHFLRQITAFITKSLGATAKVVVVTPAGAITVAIKERPEYTSKAWESLRPTLLGAAAGSIIPGKISLPVLVGLDGTVARPGKKKPHTPVQTTAWIEPGLAPVPEEMALKTHGTSNEHQLLGRGINTRVDRTKGLGPQIPPALDRTVAIKHGVLPLICHELIAFSGRSDYRARRADTEAFCDHITQVAKHTIDLKFIAVAAHALGPNSSGAFIDAMRRLVADTKRTVLVSAFAEADQLEAVARRFAVKGNDSEGVATLLVRSKTARR